ncbi:MAG: ABC transporter ATP-binding protein [Ignavibacteria bacterium]|nr:ABC transporter ATP-binding protein [Ignavibacteria bacterium]MBI3765083.1 ABC transporter ATP-binding protein [Ignavibacteriales bacterium]
MDSGISIEGLTHSYPTTRQRTTARIALSNVSFQIQSGEIFCLLGPNGSGKSTLFRILSTLLTPSEGSVRIFDLDLFQERQLIRHHIGVVFQHPSVDKKLTVRENLFHQGHLYNLRGSVLKRRIDEMLMKVGIQDRAYDLVETLSGGMRRRVELAKALLHKPRLLILDEPSTGLDPGARREFIEYLHSLRDTDRVTVLLTTHILDEAEKCDRLAILDQGSLVALGTPHDLKHEIGGDIISVSSQEPSKLAEVIRTRFRSNLRVVDGMIRIEQTKGHEFIPQLIREFPGQIESVTLSKPTLEDVFIHRTGHKFQSGKS